MQHIVVPYDHRWPEQYAAERIRLLQALGTTARRIEHNGSTAIPGLAAKAIIDIQISVSALQPMDSYLAPLEQLGYTHVPHADDSFCPFFYRPAVWPHTHHVHVVEFGGEEEARTLAFRDYLRDHADIAREYAALKFALAQQFSVTTSRHARDTQRLNPGSSSESFGWRGPAAIRIPIHPLHLIK